MHGFALKVCRTQIGMDALAFWLPYAPVDESACTLFEPATVFVR